MSKRRPEHQARSIDHRKFVDKLHWIYHRGQPGSLREHMLIPQLDITFERRMEGKTPRTNNQIAEECDEENAIMTMLPAIEHSFEC